MRNMILALGLLFMTSMSLAGPGRHKGGRDLHFMKELNLTSEQTTQVKKIKEKYEAQISQTRTLSKEAKRDLIASLQDPQRGADYNAALLEKFKKVENLKAEQDLQRFQMTLEIRETLTDDQIRKFKKYHDRGGHKGKKDHSE